MFDNLFYTLFKKRGFYLGYIELKIHLHVNNTSKKRMEYYLQVITSNLNVNLNIKSTLLSR